MDILKEIDAALKELGEDVKITKFENGKSIRTKTSAIDTGTIEIKFPEKYYSNFAYIRDLIQNVFLQRGVLLKKDTLIFTFRQNLVPPNTYFNSRDKYPYLSFEDMLYDLFVKHKYFLITRPTKYKVQDDFRVIMKVSKECNLDCVYCYDKYTRDVVGRSKPLPVEYVKKLLDILTVSCRSSTIQFHGGEPLLAGYEWYRTILEDIAPQYPWLEIEWLIQSNLLEATDEIVELFIKHKVGMGSSWNIMNPGLRRRLADNPNPATYTNSFDRLKEINKNYAELLNEGFGKIGIIDVVSNKQVDRLVELYEMYKAEGISAALNLIYEVSTMDDKTKKLIFDPSDHDQTVRAFENYYGYLLTDDKDPYDERFGSEMFTMVCGLGTQICINSYMSEDSYLGIQSDGSLLPCDTPPFNDRYYIGHITDFNTLDEIRNTEGLKTLTEELKYQENVFCVQCNYWSYCHGSCPMQNISKTGSAKFSSPTDCMLFRDRFDVMYKEIRKLDFDEIKNKIYRDKLVYRSIVLPKEIQQIFFEAKGRYLEFNENDIFGSEEFQLFRVFNPLMDGDNSFNRNSLKLYGVNDKNERLRLIKAYLEKSCDDISNKLKKKEGECNESCNGAEC